jgi:uncharacterized protein
MKSSVLFSSEAARNYHCSDSATCQSSSSDLDALPARNIFVLPLANQFLIYAPLHHVSALMDRAAVLRVQDSLLTGDNTSNGQLGELINILSVGAQPAPLPKQGRLTPAFLGLLPTRGCNLACRYCGFADSDGPHQVMSLELACQAVNWYMDLVSKTGAPHAEVHYFGGEPFCVESVLDVTVPLARMQAKEAGCSLRCEVATNGVFSRTRAEWVADNLDTVVLSFDGPADVQNLHRPQKNGDGSFEAVVRTARILSEGNVDLCLRACVTSETVNRMPEIATWFCEEFRPSAVSFEPVQPPPQSEASHLDPPDPWAFAHNLIKAAQILEINGVEPVYAPADIRTRRVTFCPVGQDTVIVSPDGSLGACYLLQRDWEAKGLDLRLGRMNGDGVQFESEAIDRVRNLNVLHKQLCAHCFCKWHCAGGCHVNHMPAGRAGAYPRLCVQTRLVTTYNILKAMGFDDSTWLRTRDAAERLVYQTSDVLLDAGDL